MVFSVEKTEYRMLIIWEMEELTGAESCSTPGLGHMGGGGGARGQQLGPWQRWPCLSWDHGRLGPGRDRLTAVMSLGAGEDGGKHPSFSRPLPSSIPPVLLVGQRALLQQKSKQ